MVRVYLDNCAFNRPFDDQGQIRIRLESEAKLYVQEKIKQGTIELIWSYILDLENAQNPYKERQRVIKRWQESAVTDIEENDQVIAMAKLYAKKGLKAKDALHLSCAIEGKANYFLTTDDKILRLEEKEIKIINPVNLVRIVDEYDN